MMEEHDYRSWRDLELPVPIFISCSLSTLGSVNANSLAACCMELHLSSLPAPWFCNLTWRQNGALNDCSCSRRIRHSTTTFRYNIVATTAKYGFPFMS